MIYIILGWAIRCYGGESVEASGDAAAKMRIRFERWGCLACVSGGAYFRMREWGLGLEWGGVEELFFAEDQ